MTKLLKNAKRMIVLKIKGPKQVYKSIFLFIF